MERKIQLDILGLFSNQNYEATFTLLLGEVSGNRRLPITIGLPEAQSIALAIEGSQLDRPLIHDIFKTMLLKLNYTLQEIIITDLKDSVFFSQITITDGENTIVIDARPSDAIALGLRFEVPLYTDQIVFDKAETLVLDICHASSSTIPKLPISSKYIKLLHDDPSTLQRYSIETLQQLLSILVDNEDYEKAALVRDELKHRRT